MQIIFLIIIAYLFLPIIGQIYLYTTGENIVAGTVFLEFIIKNIIFASIISAIIGMTLFKLRDNRIRFISSKKDKRSLRRISIIITMLAVLVFYFSGYDYLFKGSYRGDIRVSFGAFGFLYKWITIYAVPALMFLGAVIYCSDKSTTNKKYLWYIFIMGALSAIFTGYKYVIVFTFIPVFFVFLYNKNILKIVLYLTPVVLGLLTITTKMVMSYETYSQAFQFLLHRMTVMSAFGTVGVYNTYPNGAELSESIKLAYSLFGNNINEILFGIDSNTVDVLDVNLARKITYLVYPAWEAALSGTTNLTITNFGDAIYILGSFYFLYAFFAGFFVSFLMSKLSFYLNNGDIFKSTMFLAYILGAVLSWFNSTSIFILLSFPVFVYLILTFTMIYFIFKVKIK